MQRPSRQEVLKYFRNESSIEEAKLIELFLAIGEEQEFINQCLSEVSDEIQDAKEYTISVSELNRQWIKFQNLNVNYKDYGAKTFPPKVFRSKQVRMKATLYYGMVASFLIIALSIGWFYQYRAMNFTPTYITLLNDKSTFNKLVLPDSSILWLNAQTEIRYNDGFGIRHRKLEILKGEVYFDVCKNLKLPFEVSNNGFTTKVLGTAFVVSAYKELNYSRVQVIRGKVSVQAKDKGYKCLVANESVVYDIETGRSEYETFDKVGFNPNNNHVFLKDVSFEELTLRINHLLGYKIKTNSEKVKLGFYTAEIRLEDSIRDVLEHLSWLNGVTYKLVGKEAIMF